MGVQFIIRLSHCGTAINHKCLMNATREDCHNVLLTASDLIALSEYMMKRMLCPGCEEVCFKVRTNACVLPRKLIYVVTLVICILEVLDWISGCHRFF
jgi:hypothetical protein